MCELVMVRNDQYNQEKNGVPFSTLSALLFFDIFAVCCEMIWLRIGTVRHL